MKKRNFLERLLKRGCGKANTLWKSIIRCAFLLLMVEATIITMTACSNVNTSQDTLHGIELPYSQDLLNELRQPIHKVLRKTNIKEEQLVDIRPQLVYEVADVDIEYAGVSWNLQLTAATPGEYKQQDLCYFQYVATLSGTNAKTECVSVMNEVCNDMILHLGEPMTDQYVTGNSGVKMPVPVERSETTEHFLSNTAPEKALEYKCLWDFWNIEGDSLPEGRYLRVVVSGEKYKETDEYRIIILFEDTQDEYWK